jgi:hypothetical protein
MNLARSMTYSAVMALASASALAATGLPFRSSFENGDFREWNGGNDASMTVSTETATDGTRSVRSVNTAGSTTDNYKDYIFGDHARVGGTGVTEQNGLWLQFDSRFDTGFVFGSNVHKVAIVNLENEAGRRRYQIIINIWSTTGEYFVEHLEWNADGSFAGALPGMPENVGPKVYQRPGQWDRLKLFIKPNTSGQANGIIRLWVNGVLKTEYTNCALREDTNYMPNKLIMANYVNATVTNGIQRWDNWYMGETDPGGAAVRPNPPVIQGVN